MKKQNTTIFLLIIISVISLTVMPCKITHAEDDDFTIQQNLNTQQILTQQNTKDSTVQQNNENQKIKSK